MVTRLDRTPRSISAAMTSPSSSVWSRNTRSGASPSFASRYPCTNGSSAAAWTTKTSYAVAGARNAGLKRRLARGPATSRHRPPSPLAIPTRLLYTRYDASKPISRSCIAMRRLQTPDRRATRGSAAGGARPDEVLGAAERDVGGDVIAGHDQHLDVVIVERDRGGRTAHQRRIVGQVGRRLAEPLEPRAVAGDRLLHPRHAEPRHRLEHDAHAAHVAALAIRDHRGDRHAVCERRVLDLGRGDAATRGELGLDQ